MGQHSRPTTGSKIRNMALHAATNAALRQAIDWLIEHFLGS